uniref:Uncharacterized protein n=1 Tax=Anguilla anguilla TaxID=7936 RepID=A0A0E9Q6X7_ANGAN
MIKKSILQISASCLYSMY